VTPIPVSATVTGLAARFSSIHRRPAWPPVEPGANITRIWQLPPGGTAAGQSLVWVKSPVVRMEYSLSGGSKVALATTIGWAALVVWTCCWPKSIAYVSS
jgi:hypothetical protein